MTAQFTNCSLYIFIVSSYTIFCHTAEFEHLPIYYIKQREQSIRLTVIGSLSVCCAAAGVKIHDPRGHTAQTRLHMSQGSQAI